MPQHISKPDGRYKKPCPGLPKGVRCPLCGDSYVCQQSERPKTVKNSKTKAATLVTQRKTRMYQVVHRGSRRSYKTDAENLGLLLLWEVEVLSEGQVAKALDIDRVSLRMMREGAMAEAMKLAEALIPPSEKG